MTDRLGAEEVRRALLEDSAWNDITTALLGARADGQVEGRFIAEEDVVVAGGPVAGEVYRQLDASAVFEQEIPEGDHATAGTTVARVRASVRTVLAGERVALNFVQHLSGVATLTRRAVEAVGAHATTVTHTRKTLPGLRALQRYAVRVGGGGPHRASLADAVLWKDNHWRLLGAEDRLQHVLGAAPPGAEVIIEVESDAQLEAAMGAGARRILVDNQPPERVAEWVRRCGPDVSIEASGGITIERVAAYARAGARFVSLGALTHSAPAAGVRLDVSLPADG